MPAFLKANDLRIEIAFEYLNELLQKYRFMEAHMQKNKARLNEKLPEIKRTIDVIKLLEKKASGEDDEEGDSADEAKDSKEKNNTPSFTSHFPLADSIFGKASVKVNGRVNLWLGANVMLEYSYAEARALLEKNLRDAEVKLNENSSDLLFLRDMITTSEVNLARMFNHDVAMRKKNKKGDESPADKKISV